VVRGKSVALKQIYVGPAGSLCADNCSDLLQAEVCERQKMPSNNRIDSKMPEISKKLKISFLPYSLSHTGWSKNHGLVKEGAGRPGWPGIAWQLGLSLSRLLFVVGEATVLSQTENRGTIVDEDRKIP
jgi:hypothetical protein